MQRVRYFGIITLLVLVSNTSYSQELKFNRILRNIEWGSVTDMAQDQEGFIWFATFSGGFHRFDGTKLKSYVNESRNPNSLISDKIRCLEIDSSNKIWIGTWTSGIDRFDPVTNTFTHFRNIPNNPTSLINDSITAMLVDHSGNLWIGTEGGLDQLDIKTGKFRHYAHNKNVSTSLSSNHIRVIYEDLQGVLWVGCDNLSLRSSQVEENGGLNKFDKNTGIFTRYLHDPGNPKSIEGNAIGSIYEDRKGNFWVGTNGDGLHSMDRQTGIFSHYYFDPARPEKLSRPPYDKTNARDNISFIQEDVNGALWIASIYEGINRYDPKTQKITHFGNGTVRNGLLSTKDTLDVFTGYPYKAIVSNDGLFWVCTLDGSIFNLNLAQYKIPYYDIKQLEANSFYCEGNGNILWIGTDEGLLRKDLNENKEKLWVHDPLNTNSLGNDTIYSLKVNHEGKIWIGTNGGGLNKFDPVTGNFVHYLHDDKNSNSICNNYINNLFIDQLNNLWMATDSGIAKMDQSTGLISNYTHSESDSTSLIHRSAICITEDRDYAIWVGSNVGLCRLDVKSGKFNRYPIKSTITSLCVDSKGVLWAGGRNGLYYFDKINNQFLLFTEQNFPIGISGVLGITEDDNKSLWVSNINSIIEVNADRSKIRKYAENHGVKENLMGWCDNFKGRDGKLFLGHFNGYYAFFPDQIKKFDSAPQLNIANFKLGEKEILAGEGNVLSIPLWQTKEINLRHNQNIFSFDFFAIDYIFPGDEKYMFMLENYDNNWHDIGSDHSAYFFHVPPGNYTFRAKAINGDGSWAEKSIKIVISPPWWRRWWAYSIYVLLLFVGALALYRIQKRLIVRAERQKTQERELIQAKEIEKAYNQLGQAHENLKNTQTQLIHAGKMASLGELTAGIAHEIQNPLNFVNNFSEINKELLEELKNEVNEENENGVRLINDILQNEQKIIQHGKRADVIVKGMLQHSRSTSDKKELTDINALCGDYIRLAYHAFQAGLQAKDASFQAKYETHFDPDIPRIHVIPQELGRALLNIINNAFQACAERSLSVVGERLKGEEDKGEKVKASADERIVRGENSYDPLVTLTTMKVDKHIEIRIKDNGPGIPENIVDKIFQPFFTTKPTGQGTGLGLSLAYDIITKGHSGSLDLKSRVNKEGAEFIISLPVN